MSAKVFKTKFSKYISNASDIFKEIDLNEFQRRKEASTYIVRLIKKNVSKKGNSSSGGFPAKRTGYLQRRIGRQFLKDDRSVRIGTKDFKAHLIEFGHGDGKERNKRPFLTPSFIAGEDKIIEIMSKPYF
jgi:hypothetical protein